MATSCVCSIPNCDKPRVARGFCESHYRRWKRHGDPLGGGVSNGTLPDWIDRVALQHPGKECLIWPFGRHKDGYAQGSYPGIETKHASRAICWLKHGPPPTPEHDAAHSCGNGRRGCVNPAHISWKTRAENEADKIPHGTLVRGSAHVNSRLTEADVQGIRELLGKISHQEIAARFGVSRATISLIAAGRTWGWLR